jgi:hypothetical protein
VVTEPVVLPTVATAVLEDVHVTVLVRSLVDPSVNVPIALNCTVMPRERDGLVGLTAKLTSPGGVTVSVVLPVREPKAAVTEVMPRAKLVASPAVPGVLLILATVDGTELHITAAVTSRELPSLSVSVAVNLTVLPSITDGFTGTTRIAGRTAKFGNCAVDPPTVTERGPVDAPRGTITAIIVLVADTTVAGVPLNLTTSAAGLWLNPCP